MRALAPVAISIALLFLSPVAHAVETPVSAPEEGRVDSSQATVVSSDSTSIAVWVSGNHIFARELSSDGTPAGPTQLVAVGSHSYAQPGVAWLGDRYRVVWTSNELRYEYHLETIDLDRHGRRIDGSAVDLGEELVDPLITNVGQRVLVAARRYASSRPELHWFVQEPSGTLRHGVLWLDFFRYAVVARGSHFEFILLNENSLSRFDLETGQLSQLDVTPRRINSFVATTSGNRTYIASSTYQELTLTILEDELIKSVAIGATVDTWPQRIDVIGEEVLVANNLGDKTRLYRLDLDGNVLQQVDTDLGRLSLSGWIDGPDLLVAVFRKTDPSYRGSLFTRRMQRTPDGLSTEGTDELFSVATTSQFSPAIATNPLGARIIAWIEQGEVDGITYRIRCVIFDPVSGSTGQPIEIAEVPYPYGLSVAASQSRFLITFHAENAHRAVTLDFAGNKLSDLPVDVSFSNTQWAAVGDVFVLAYGSRHDGLSSIEIAFFDGETLEAPRVVASGEPLGDGNAIEVVAPLISVGSDNILITWGSYVPSCVSVPCYEATTPHALLLDRFTLEPVSDRIEFGDEFYDVIGDLAFDGHEFGIWLPTAASIIRLSAAGAFLDDEPIRVRDSFSNSYSLWSSLHGLDGGFAVVWEEATQTRNNGLGVRIVHPDRSLSSIRGFSVRSDYPSVVASADGDQVLLAFTRMVPDDVMRGATRVHVREVKDMPVLSPPTAPRIRAATALGGRIIVSWDDLSEDEDLFIIEVRDSVRLFYAESYVALKNSTSREVRPSFDGPRQYRVRAWNAAGPSEPSGVVGEAPPERRRPVRP